MAATKTETGLEVCCEIDGNRYPKGVQVIDLEMQAINLTRAKFHGEWNDTIAPNQQPPWSSYFSAAPKQRFVAWPTE
jgi:Rhodopirellula transposase DDE domain